MKRFVLFAKLSALAAVLGVMLATPVYAADDSAGSSSKSAICEGAALGGADCDGSADNSLNDVVKTIVNLLSSIVGIAAVIMIIVSGFRYITSGGDSNKISAAKTGLIYALVGLVVVALAQTIVRFVLEKAS